jgi:serine/threonine protein phosphatase 1
MNTFKEITENYQRVFVVGDIHACLAELDVMLEFLLKQCSLSANDLLIFIGDYIDRGPDSKGVISRLIDLQAQFPHTVFLKGNHEDMLLSYLGYPGHNGEIYLYNGGVECLMSYNMTTVESQEATIQSFPTSHMKFFRELEKGVEMQDYIFVHAGLNPYRPIAKQKEEDLFWIRGDFIMSIHPFKKTIVFGHTPYQDVLFDLPFKIGIDTGLVYGNKLSCIELVKGEIYQLSRGSTDVVVSSFKDRQLSPA